MEKYIPLSEYAKKTGADIKWLTSLAKNRDDNGLEKAGVFDFRQGAAKIAQDTKIEELEKTTPLLIEKKIQQRVGKNLSSGEKTAAVLFNKFRSYYATRSMVDETLEFLEKSGTIQRFFKQSKNHGSTDNFRFVDS